MRSLRFIVLGICLVVISVCVGRAATLTLTDGTSVTGEIILPATAEGVNVRVGQGKYERVAWEKLSQETLQELARNPRLVQYVEPLIEPPEDERAQKTQITIKPVEHLERPQPTSLFSAFFHSSVGIFALLVFYAVGLYAAYEIAVIRVRPPLLVCGISAIAPVIGQIIFLSLPVPKESPKEKGKTREAADAQATQAPSGGAAEAAKPAEVGGLQLAQRAEAGASGNIPETQVFQRGKFMFNRRFFETKFSGFFGMIRRDTDKDMMLLIKGARGEYLVTRISRITGNEMHLTVSKGGASQEVSIPFSEVMEVQLKHKDAP